MEKANMPTVAMEKTEGANFSGLKINIISFPAKLKLWPTLPRPPPHVEVGRHLNPFAYPPDRRLVAHPLCTSGSQPVAQFLFHSRVITT